MKKKHYICVFLFTSFVMLMFTFWDFLMFYPPSPTLKEILSNEDIQKDKEQHLLYLLAFYIFISLYLKFKKYDQ